MRHAHKQQAAFQKSPLVLINYWFISNTPSISARLLNNVLNLNVKENPI